MSLEPLRLVAGPWYRSDQGFTDSVGLQQSPESVGRQKMGGGGGTQGEAGKSGSREASNAGCSGWQIKGGIYGEEVGLLPWQLREKRRGF